MSSNLWSERAWVRIPLSSHFFFPFSPVTYFQFRIRWYALSRPLQSLNVAFAMISAPSPASPTFRADLAKLISPLKRIRPRVPFWQLAAHRIPTLSLYRGLLRNASTEDVGVPGLISVGALVNVPFVKPRFGSECGCCSERTCI